MRSDHMAFSAAPDYAVGERSFRRRIANRESARRSRARKQRHLDDLRESAALLERENRDLAGRTEAARATLAVALVANAALRAEAAALSRRLVAASQAHLVLGRRRLYYNNDAGADDDAVSIDGDVRRRLLLPSLILARDDVEEMIASLMAEPPHDDLHLHSISMHACF